MSAPRRHRIVPDFAPALWVGAPFFRPDGSPWAEEVSGKAIAARWPDRLAGDGGAIRGQGLPVNGFRNADSVRPPARTGTALALSQRMKSLLACLSLLLLWVLPLRAQNEELWVSDLGGQDTMTVQVGQVVEFRVNIRTNNTRISGFQCFMTFPEEIAETVPYSEAPNGWFQNTNLFPGSVVFADDHDHRLDPMPDNQLDWCYQTGTQQPRPTFVANGVACRFKVRFLQPMNDYRIRFDHDNIHFRNTIFWQGDSADERPFWQERTMHVNVVGVELGPLPDLYLTTPAPCDSLNLYEYLDDIEDVEPADYAFRWRTLGGNTACSVDTYRTVDAFWMVFCGTGPGRRADFEVCASVMGLTACDTLAVLRGDPPIIDDAVSDGDPFLQWAEDETASLSLDDFVTDLDDPIEDLVWSLLPDGRPVTVSIDPLTRVAEFASPPDWNGRDTLRLRVVDPGGMADVARVLTLTWPVNDAPRIDFVERAEVHPGQPLVIDLEAVTVDIDNPWSELAWSMIGDTSAVAARVDPLLHTLTLDVQEGTPLWTELQFVGLVQDLEGLSDTDTLDVLVSSYPPIWQPIPEVLLPGATVVTRELFDYVDDQDDADPSLTLWATGESQVQVQIDGVTGLASFSVAGVWTGVERLVFWARDNDGNQDSVPVAVYALQGGNPLVVEVPDLLMLPGAVDSLELDLYVRDYDTPVTDLVWEIFHNSLFGVTVNPTTRRAFVTAPLLPGTVDLALYRATDPESHYGEDTGVLAVIDPSGQPLILPLQEIWMRTSAIDTSLHLDGAVYDYDNSPEEMQWTIGQGNLVSGLVRADRRLQLSSGFLSGTETISLTVQDPDLRQASGSLVVHVSEGRPPIVSEFPARYVIAGRTDTLRNLSAYVYDPDEGDVLTWSFIDPVDSPLHALSLPAIDAAVILTDPDHLGLDRLGAVASDRELNSDLAWIDVHSLENRPPVIEAAVWPNPGLPAQLDVVVVADEALRSLSGWQASDGAPLAFAELSVGQPRIRIYRSDWQAPGGVETLHFRAIDLPGYPQVTGNETRDSLVISSGLLGGPGSGLPSPDGDLRLAWLEGEARWLIEQPARGPDGEAWERGWRVAGAAGGLVRAVAGSPLESWDGADWVPHARDSAIEGSTWLRPATGSAPALPERLVLHDPWPNPFNPLTRIGYELPAAGPLRLEIVDLLGRVTRSLASGRAEAGRHEALWDGCDDGGRPAASGVYFARLRAADEQRVTKLILLR